MPKVYVVDDEPSICQSLKDILSDEAYQVELFEDASGLYPRLEQQVPDLILLDIWLPGPDGMEVLKHVKQAHPQLPVIMMSGHAGIDAAVKSIKLGAYDFLEKPLHLEVLLDKVASAITANQQNPRKEYPSDTRLDLVAPEHLEEGLNGAASLVTTQIPQRTLGKNVVLNGTGLLSGRHTGVILCPLEEDRGIVFQTLEGHSIQGHVTSLENYAQALSGTGFTANSTVLGTGKGQVRTVEHLLAALYMYGITNVLVKADEEIPNIDGSAADFCRMIEEAGILEQAKPRKEVVIHTKISLGEETPDQKHIFIEPMEGFEVRMRVNYPAPIFEQEFHFNPDHHDFKTEIAPARSFNTFENIDLAQKMGKVGTGYLNSHIIMHDGKVINTELRFQDEFVRHKVLDLIGDLYLLGYPLRGRVTANMTSHGYNQVLAKKIYQALG